MVIRTADIVIIGSGASGAAIAWNLSKAGFKIVCLEQGPWMQPKMYPTAQNNWEFQSSTSAAYDPNIRKLEQDYPINDSQSDITPLMFNAVGGSTIHWTAHSPRFHPSDFRVKSLDGVADDWPISYEDLEQYYDLNDHMMGCSGINGDPANPERKQRPMPPLPLGPDGERMANAFDELGWHWWPSDSYVNSTPYMGRSACNNCGPNGLGCYQKAKGSTDVTYWPEAIKNGVELRTNCRVFEITTGPNKLVTGVRYYGPDKKEHFQPASSVVMATNGIGTPRLLLLSKSDEHPNGLGNSSNLIGKNLMFHPYAIITGIFSDNIPPTYKGPLGNILLSQEFYETDPQRDFVRGYTYQINRSSGPARTAIGLAAPMVPWGKAHHESFSKRFANSTLLAVIGEDLPEESNKVDLDPELRDSSGIPAPRIFYKLSQNSRKLLDHGIKNAKTVLEKAGATETLVVQLLRGGGWHLMGTARMGTDPKKSVVDPNGQSHDIDNLFIVDGSVMVTSAAVNPTPTIQALALRTGDYIKKSRGDLKSTKN